MARSLAQKTASGVLDQVQSAPFSSAQFAIREEVSRGSLPVPFPAVSSFSTALFHRQLRTNLIDFPGLLLPSFFCLTQHVSVELFFTDLSSTDSNDRFSCLFSTPVCGAAALLPLRKRSLLAVSSPRGWSLSRAQQAPGVVPVVLRRRLGSPFSDFLEAGEVRSSSFRRIASPRVGPMPEVLSLVPL